MLLHTTQTVYFSLFLLLDIFLRLSEIIQTNHCTYRSDYDVTELKLENEHSAIHGLGGIVPTAPAKPTWSNRACDTLESIVHQATCHKLPETNLSSMAASSGGTWTDDSGQQPSANGWIRKRTRSDSDYHGKNVSSTSTTSNVHEEQTEYQMDNDTTLNTWTSFESAKTKSNDDDSTCHEGLVSGNIYFCIHYQSLYFKYVY